MKLFDKVKNMFTEEVEEEVQVEQVKPKKEKKNSVEVLNQIAEEEIQREEVKKPVFFTDEDFNDMDQYRNNFQPKVEKQPEPVIEKQPEPVIKEEPKIEPYRAVKAYEEVKPTKKFKPTPIISPVYGILDKNYHKEDIVNRTDDTEYTSVDKFNVDSVRDKAYGTLEDELENTLFGNNSILFNEDKNNVSSITEEKESNNDDLLDDLKDEDKELQDLENITMDIGKELDSLLNKKEKYTEDSEDDLFDLIDSMYEGDE